MVPAVCLIPAEVNSDRTHFHVRYKWPAWVYPDEVSGTVFGTRFPPRAGDTEVPRSHSLMTESGCRWCTTSCTCLTQDAHLCFRLLRPVDHAHFAVHRYRGGEVLLSLPGIARAVMRLAETEVAVGNERTHAARFGEHQRLAVVAFGVLSAARRGNVTAEAKGVALASASPQASGECQGFTGVAG